MEMSVGAIEGKTLQILSGPLGDVEDGRIVKIDRHKRKAFMEMELFGRTQRFQVGLEVRTKTA
ncbi:MAG: hypothetical protein LUC32_05890 [Clostridiales bacterium]|nr:hypothetical protein [Clostridiales bacterium]